METQRLVGSKPTKESPDVVKTSTLCGHMLSPCLTCMFSNVRVSHHVKRCMYRDVRTVVVRQLHTLKSSRNAPSAKVAPSSDIHATRLETYRNIGITQFFAAICYLCYRCGLNDRPTDVWTTSALQKSDWVVDHSNCATANDWSASARSKGTAQEGLPITSKSLAGTSHHLSLYRTHF